ncbi:MAG TPA: PrsW family glutamic-type intramembrane protease [Thermoanaerobaculaceae bacterium]|nr:PrsW family glutamic-type intramembrane protease [Thermoanaerobaculaceae bacterium]
MSESGRVVAPWKAVLQLVVAPTVVVVVAVNSLWGGRAEPDPRRRIANALGCRLYGIAEREYRSLLQQNLHDIELHRGYLSTHFTRPARASRGSARDDGPILREYQGYAATVSDPALADLGNYGLGYAWTLQGEHEHALRYYRLVRNQALPYLNNSVGYSLVRIGQPLEAERRFKAEIALDANVAGAVFNLALLYFESGRLGDLRALAEQPGAIGFFPKGVVRFLDIRRLHLASYAWSVIAGHKTGAYGVAGAVLLLAGWFVFVRRLDVFEPEPLPSALACLAGGMASSLLATPLYDALDFGLGFRLTGHPAHDLLFCVFGIGVVEELVKVLPVLAMIRWSRAVDESVDYFVYASLSALGFAFVENLMYFNDGGLAGIVGRGLTAVLLHMALTSLAVYGLFYARYRSRRRAPLWFAASFGAACALHGLYDYWLVEQGWVGSLAIVSTLVLVYTVSTYRQELLCALNVSEYGRSRTVSLTVYLCAWIVLVFLAEYLVLASRFGVADANLVIVSQGISSFMLIVVVLAVLGTFEVHQGAWVGLRWRPERAA